ncbi:AMP-binding protein [Sphingomonas sp. MMS24-JH45]
MLRLRTCDALGAGDEIRNGFGQGDGDGAAYSVPKPIDHVLRGAPDAVALVDREGTMSFAEVEDAVARLAGLAGGAGAAGGGAGRDLVAQDARRLPDAAGGGARGAVHVPVNPMLKRAQVAHILADSGASLLLTQASRAATLEAGDVPAGCALAIEAGEGCTCSCCHAAIPIRWRRSSTPPARPGGRRG